MVCVYLRTHVLHFLGCLEVKGLLGIVLSAYSVQQEGTHVSEVFAGFSFAEHDACRQSVDDPGACLDDTALRLW